MDDTTTPGEVEVWIPARAFNTFAVGGIRAVARLEQMGGIDDLVEGYECVGLFPVDGTKIKTVWRYPAEGFKTVHGGGITYDTAGG